MKNQIQRIQGIRLLGTASAGLIASLLLTAARPSAGQPIYQTGFEPPTFQAGLPLVGQDGWVAPPPFSPGAAVVTTDKPRQGQQTVHVLGEDLVHQDFINEVTGGYYDAIGSYRRPVNYDTQQAQTLKISAHVRIDGPGTAPGNNFFSAGVSTRALTTDGTASVGEIALSSDGHAYVYSGNDSVPTFLAGTAVSLGTWHELAVVADFAARSSSFFVDGQFLGTFPFDPTETYTGIFLRGTLLVYAAPDSAHLTKADYAAHFDRFSIKVVSADGGD